MVVDSGTVHHRHQSFVDEPSGWIGIEPTLDDARTFSDGFYNIRRGECYKNSFIALQGLLWLHTM